MSIRKKIDNWLLRRKIKKAIDILVRIDVTMKKLGYPRYKRKQFWRDFITSAAKRKETFDGLEKEANKAFR